MKNKGELLKELYIDTQTFPGLYIDFPIMLECGLRRLTVINPKYASYREDLQKMYNDVDKLNEIKNVIDAYNEVLNQEEKAQVRADEAAAKEIRIESFTTEELLKEIRCRMSY